MLPCPRRTTMSTTSSPPRSSIPFTPVETRPMGRTSLSVNRTAWPLRVTSITSSLPSVIEAPIRLSSS